MPIKNDMHILLTRPLEDCSEMILKFKSLGHQVSHLPLLTIEKMKYEEINFSDYSGIIFTSANAIKFLEFLVTKEAQQHIVNNTFEYPMIDGVKPNKLISQFGTSFKQDTKTKVSKYYKNQKKALALMKKAGWK